MILFQWNESPLDFRFHYETVGSDHKMYLFMRPVVFFSYYIVIGNSRELLKMRILLENLNCHSS